MDKNVCRHGVHRSAFCARCTATRDRLKQNKEYREELKEYNLKPKSVCTLCSSLMPRHESMYICACAECRGLPSEKETLRMLSTWAYQRININAEMELSKNKSKSDD